MERAASQDRTEEVAVMIDTFHPLRLGPASLEASDDQYAWSWSRQP
jgi:homogentisate 1,2-dioxygenase